MSADGSLKGVMLCDRPVDPAPAAAGPPFIPGNVCRDPPGVAPHRKLMPVRKVVHVTPLDRHKQMIRTLSSVLASRRQDATLQRDSEQARERSLRERSEKLHKEILARDPFAPSTDDAAGQATAAPPERPRPPRLEVESRAPLFVSELPREIPDDTLRDLEREMADLIEGALSTGDAGKGTQGEKGGRESESRKTAAAAPEEPRAAEGAERAAAEDVAREPSQATKAEVAAKASGPSAAARRGADIDDDLPDDEVADLLDFAENLDFDRYLEDIEDEDLRAAMEVLKEEEGATADGRGAAANNAVTLEALKRDAQWRKNFVRAMNHVALRRAQARAQRAADGRSRAANGAASVAGSEAPSTFALGTEASRAREQEGAAHRAAAAERGGDKGGWDGSTRAGDSAVARMEAADKRREADDFLRENPELRAIHSSASAKRMLESVQPAA